MFLSWIENGADIFEDVSRSVKSEATRAQQDTLRDRPAPDSEHLLAEEQKPLFEVIHFPQSSSFTSLDFSNRKSIIPKISMMKHYNLHYLTFSNKLTISNNQVSVSARKNSIGRSLEYFHCVHSLVFCNSIWLSLKQLVDKGHIEKLRFWGKIYGSQKNYFVAEAEQNTDEGGGDDDEGTEETPHNDDNKGMGEDEDMDGEEDPLPKSTYKAPPVVPKEERGTGVNKYTYYVCNHRKCFLRLE